MRIDLEKEIVGIVRVQQLQLNKADVHQDNMGDFWAYGDAESRSVSGPAVNLSALARELEKLLDESLGAAI